jgi:hypothetical protein
LDLAKAERAAQAIQQKLDRLDEALMFERSIWPSQGAFCRGRQTSGSKRRSSSGSGSNCSFLWELRSTATALLEPA